MIGDYPYFRKNPFSTQFPLAGSGYKICRYSRYQKPLDRMRSTLTPVRTRGDCRKGSSGLGGKRDRLAGWYCRPSPAPRVRCLKDGNWTGSQHNGLGKRKDTVAVCFCNRETVECMMRGILQSEFRSVWPNYAWFNLTLPPSHSKL